MSLYERALLDTPHGWLMAGLIGLAFGFWLERAGFGSSRRLAGIFYLSDFAVVQVMFTAVATAALGLVGLDAAGVIDMSAIHHVETRYGAQIVGGLIFGIGFVIAGWCPGTALVGLGSGKLDALAYLLGAMAGALGFAAAWPALLPYTDIGACGVITLPGQLGIAPATLAASVVLAALAMFALVHAYQRQHPQPQQDAQAMPSSIGTQAAALAAMALALAVVAFDRPTADTTTRTDWATAIEHGADHITPRELADRLMSGADVLVVDVRPAGEFAAGFHLPGAVNLDLPRLLGPAGQAVLDARPAALVVLCSNGMTHPGQAWVELVRRGGREVRILEDGLDGFVRDVLTPPSLRAVTTEARAAAERPAFEAARAFFLDGAPSPASATPAHLATDPDALTAPTVVSTAWVAQRGAALVIVDTRTSADDYAAGHIPGAIHVPTPALREKRNGVVDELLLPAKLAEVLGALGIAADSEVVAYGDDKLNDPAHFAIALLSLGHERLAILEGGWNAWEAEQRPIATEATRRTPTHYTPREVTDLRAELADVRAASSGANGTAILDVRPAPAFRGEGVSREARPGHIPGAINRPYTTDLAASSTGLYWRSLDQLRAEYAAIGLGGDRPVIVHCRTGHQASLGYFTLRYLLGHPHVRWYDGSWTEWALHTELPAELGPGNLPQ